jgi:hypothetical protein
MAVAISTPIAAMKKAHLLNVVLAFLSDKQNRKQCTGYTPIT